MFKKLFMSKSKLFQRQLMLRTSVFIRGKSDEKVKCKSKNQDLVSQHLKLSHHAFITMDDMPVPSGSWKASYVKKNKYYNRILLIGIASLITSITILWKNVLYTAVTPPYPFEDVECVPKSMIRNIIDEDEKNN